MTFALSPWFGQQLTQVAVPISFAGAEAVVGDLDVAIAAEHRGAAIDLIAQHGAEIAIAVDVAEAHHARCVIRMTDQANALVARQPRVELQAWRDCAAILAITTDDNAKQANTDRQEIRRAPGRARGCQDR